MKNTTTQPTVENERLLNEVIENNPEELEAFGRKWHVGYMRNGTKRKVTDILLNEKEEDKVNAKCAAAMLLNGYFKILFFYWALWRWIYYIRQAGDKELLPILSYCKKKVDVESYCIATIYLTEMRDTMMTMTRKEVDSFLHANRGEQPGISERSTDASLNP